VTAINVTVATLATVMHRTQRLGGSRLVAPVDSARPDVDPTATLSHRRAYIIAAHQPPVVRTAVVARMDGFVAAIYFTCSIAHEGTSALGVLHAPGVFAHPPGSIYIIKSTKVSAIRHLPGLLIQLVDQGAGGVELLDGQKV
jgi:hypothetical protein